MRGRFSWAVDAELGGKGSGHCGPRHPQHLAPGDRGGQSRSVFIRHLTSPHGVTLRNCTAWTNRYVCRVPALGEGGRHSMRTGPLVETGRGRAGTAKVAGDAAYPKGVKAPDKPLRSNGRAFRVLDLPVVVGAAGFEPATPCAQGRCATRLRYAPTGRALNYPTPARGQMGSKRRWASSGRRRRADRFAPGQAKGFRFLT